MPVILYINPVSVPCHVVLYTAEYLGIKLMKKYVDLFGGELLKPEFLAKNPQHCIPTIEDDGFYLWESRAIATYLVNKYAPDSPLYPKDPRARAVVDRMLNYDLGSLNKALIEYRTPIMLEDRSPEPEQVENMKKSLAILEKTLEKTSYVAGNHLTVADFSIFGTLLIAVQLFDFSLADFPKITSWLERMKEEAPRYKEISEEPLMDLKAKFPEVKAAVKKLYSKKN